MQPRRIGPQSRRHPFLAHAVGLFAPPACLCCADPLARAALGPGLCERCAAEIERAPGRRLVGEAIDGGFAPLDYTGAGRRLVAALKFDRLLAVAELAAALIAAAAPAEILRGTIVPVPPASVRFARRGFDPAEEIALALAEATGLPVSACLRRRDAGHQRGRSRSRRLARAPRFSPVGALPAHALLVDDVTTTGATIDACARALRREGSTRVLAVALATVPRRSALPGHGRAA
jgi:predicted amidophosphoribosyltransferase